MELEEIAEGGGPPPPIDGLDLPEDHSADPALDWVDAYEF